jgi:hypothetical protein
MDAAPRARLGAIVSPQLAWLLGTGTLVRKLSEKRSFVERSLFGLRYYTAPNAAALDEAVAPHPKRERAGPRDVEEHEEARKSNVGSLLESTTEVFLWSSMVHHTASPVPWESLVLRAEAEVLLLIAIFAALVVAGTSTWECFRGFEATYHASMAASVALLTSFVALTRPLVYVGWNRLEVKIALGFGVAAAVSAFAMLVRLYLVSPAGYPIAGLPGVGGAPAGFLDLGASMRAGMRDAVGRVTDGLGIENAPSSYTEGPIFFLLLGISAALGAIVGLLFLPVLRLGRCLTGIVATTEGRGNQTSFFSAFSFYIRRQAVVGWQYAPALLASLWVTAVSTRFVSPALVRCTADAISRDCTPDGTLVGDGRALFASLGLRVVEGGLGDVRTVMGETDWLRVRLILVLVYALSWLYMARPLLTRYLATAKAGVMEVIDAAALTAAGAPSKGKAERGRSGLGVEALTALQRRCAVEAQRPLLSITVVLLQMTALPLLIACIAFLTARFSGTALGVCDVALFALPAVARAGRAGGPPRPEGLVQLTEMLLSRVTGLDVTSTVAAGQSSMYLLRPAFWLPLLSFALPFLLTCLFLMMELAFLYWRYLQPGATEALREKLRDSITADNISGGAEGTGAKKGAKSQ